MNKREKYEEDKNNRKMKAISMELMSMGYGLDGDQEKFKREVKEEYESRKRNGEAC